MKAAAAAGSCRRANDSTGDGVELIRRRNGCLFGEISKQVVSYDNRSAANWRLWFYWK